MFAVRQASSPSQWTAIRLDDFDVNDPYMGKPPVNSDSDAVSLAFLISLSVTFALLMIVLVVMAIYVTFCGPDEAEYDEELGVDGHTGTLGINFGKKKNSILLDSSFSSPGKFDDDAELLERETAELPKMSPFEISLYVRAKEFQKLNPPIVKKMGSYVSESDVQFIKDRGIQSYYFLPSINDNVDKQGNFYPSFIVQDKLDITFTKYNKSSSSLLNYPLPVNKKDAVYFEVKVFRFPANSNSIFSIGLSTCPYPYFRIPGMSMFSIAYESTGKLRINNPFMASTLLPRLQEGDVVGFGYKFKLGTIFITHNGKKLMDVTQNVGIDLFVSIGAMNASYTRTYTKDGLLEDPDNVEYRQILSEGGDILLPKDLQSVHDPAKGEEIPSDEIELRTNLGQLGYVFIEANVKKYSFGSTFGEIGIPPAYNGAEIQKDTVLQKGDDLPPTYPSQAASDDFFGGISINKGSRSTDRRAVDDHTIEEAASDNRDTIPKTVEVYERNSSAFDREHNYYDNSGLTTEEEEEVGEGQLAQPETNKKSSGVNKKKNNNKKKKKKRKSKKNKRRS